MPAINEIIAAFVLASHGKLTPLLMKYSVAVDGERLQARIVVLDAISEDELEIVFDILGDMMGHLGGLGDFEVVKAASVAEARESPPLPILLYWAYRLDAER